MFSISHSTCYQDLVHASCRLTFYLYLYKIYLLGFILYIIVLYVICQHIWWWIGTRHVRIVYCTWYVMDYVQWIAHVLIVLIVPIFPCVTDHIISDNLVPALIIIIIHLSCEWKLIFVWAYYYIALNIIVCQYNRMTVVSADFKINRYKVNASTPDFPRI